MSSRDFWIRLEELEMPGKVVSLYSRLTPPEEPGTWVRVEIATIPGKTIVKVAA